MAETNDKGPAGGNDKGPKPKEVELRFKDIPEAEQANFKMPETATLQAAWDQAYDEMGLERGANDVLQTAGTAPVSMQPYLSYTLQRLKDEKIVHAYNFEIVAATGGA